MLSTVLVEVKFINDNYTLTDWFTSSVCRGVKATLWEGGVRGVGLINSPLLQKSGYVAQQMLHVCDWLPTLYEAAGGDPSTLKNLDGVSAWKMLSTNGPPVRSEMLHNIDPIGQFAGIRVGDFKLVTGNIGNGYNDWYPPWQVAGDEQRLHVNTYKSDGNDKHSQFYLTAHNRIFAHKDSINTMSIQLERSDGNLK